MLERLARRREAAERRCDEAAAAIPAAILDGDERGLRRLRAERRDAAVEADDLGEAIDLAQERERRASEEAEAERRRGLMRDAAALADERERDAAAVDEALAALEAAVVRHRDRGLELSAALRAAGCREDRIARIAGQDMRWATWNAAPTAAGLMQVPRAPAHRRRPLAELQSAAVPAIGAEG